MIKQCHSNLNNELSCVYSFNLQVDIFREDFKKYFFLSFTELIICFCGTSVWGVD